MAGFSPSRARLIAAVMAGALGPSQLGVVAFLKRTRARLARVRSFEPMPSGRVTPRGGPAGSVVLVARVAPRHRTSGRMPKSSLVSQAATEGVSRVTATWWTIASDDRPRHAAVLAGDARRISPVTPTLWHNRPLLLYGSRSGWRWTVSDETRDTHQFDVAGNPRRHHRGRPAR